MDLQQMMMLLPGITPEEFMLLQNITSELSPEQQSQFMQFYQGKRRDPQSFMILTLLGFVGVAGVQRFITGDIALGVLYFLTGGLCLVGTIVDLVNYKKLASDFNQKQAFESAAWVKMLGQQK